MLSSEALGKTLGLSLKTIRNISNIQTAWIVKDQLTYDLINGKFGSKIISLRWMGFFKRKTNNIWCFGLVERGKGRLYALIVPKRHSKR